MTTKDLNSICSKVDTKKLILRDEEYKLNKYARMHQIPSENPQFICRQMKTNSKKMERFKNYMVDKKKCKNTYGLAATLSDISPDRFIVYDDNGKYAYCDDVEELDTYLINQPTNMFTRAPISIAEKIRIRAQANSIDKTQFLTLGDQLNSEAETAFRDVNNNDELDILRFVQMQKIDFRNYLTYCVTELNLISDKIKNHILDQPMLSLMKLEFCRIIKDTKFSFEIDEIHADFCRALSTSLLTFNCFCGPLSENEINGLMVNCANDKVWNNFTAFNELAIHIIQSQNIRQLFDIFGGDFVFEDSSLGREIVSQTVEENCDELNQMSYENIADLADELFVYFKRGETDASVLIKLIQNDLLSRRKTIKKLFTSKLALNGIYPDNEQSIGARFIKVMIKFDDDRISTEHILINWLQPLIEYIAEELNIEPAETHSVIAQIKHELVYQFSDITPPQQMWKHFMMFDKLANQIFENVNIANIYSKYIDNLSNLSREEIAGILQKYKKLFGYMPIKDLQKIANVFNLNYQISASPIEIVNVIEQYLRSN